MQEENKQNKTKIQTNFDELIVAVFAEDIHKAEEIEEFLKANEIPAMIKENYDDVSGKGIAVMVPEDYIDQADAVINSQDTYDDFYEMLDQEDD